jgi:hypothetical protein
MHDRDGGLRINDAFFDREEVTDTDVRVNVALFNATKTGERPIVRRPAPSEPPRDVAPRPRAKTMALAVAVVVTVAAVSAIGAVTLSRRPAAPGSSIAASAR